MAKIPSAWQVTAGSKTKKEVTARIDMSAEVAGQGLCPECRQEMESAVVDDSDVLVCMKDRIVLPTKDEDHEDESSDEAEA